MFEVSDLLSVLPVLNILQVPHFFLGKQQFVFALFIGKCEFFLEVFHLLYEDLFVLEPFLKSGVLYFQRLRSNSRSWHYQRAGIIRGKGRLAARGSPSPAHRSFCIEPSPISYNLLINYLRNACLKRVNLAAIGANSFSVFSTRAFVFAICTLGIKWRDIKLPIRQSYFHIIMQQMFQAQSKEECSDGSCAALTTQLELLQSKIQRLETFCLKKTQVGNLYAPQCRVPKGPKYDSHLNPPPYTKLFSLSSISSAAYSKLTQPYPPILLEILDSQGRRRTSFGGSTYVKKHKKSGKAS